jgi:hypothetical protein
LPNVLKDNQFLSSAYFHYSDALVFVKVGKSCIMSQSFSRLLLFMPNIVSGNSLFWVWLYTSLMILIWCVPAENPYQIKILGSCDGRGMIVWSSMPNLGYPPQGNCHIEAKQVLLILGQPSLNPKPYSSFKIVIQLQFGHFFVNCW